MAPRYVKRTSDGSTIDVIEEEAEQADTTANDRRTLLVDSAGTTIKIVRSRENLAGSAGTGSDGDSDRVYSLTTSNSVDIVEVFFRWCFTYRDYKLYNQQHN